MAKISTYPVDSSISGLDILIGSDADNANITKNYKIGDISTYVKSTLNLAVTQVLAASDTTNQAPSELNERLQVKFGPAQYTDADPVKLDNFGNITFNQAGFYLFNGYGNFERQGSSGGVTVTLFRVLLNGIQKGPTKGVELSGTGIMFPYELTIPIQVSARDVLTWEIMRDSSGVNGGGLYVHTNSGPWSNVPSADVFIYKVGI
jgi:hypothetical protein